MFEIIMDNYLHPGFGEIFSIPLYLLGKLNALGIIER